MKQKLTAILTVLLVSLPSFAIEQPAQDPRVETLARDLHAVGRVVALAEDPDRYRQVLLAIIDSDIDMVRMPREDGSYQWASYQRVEGGRVEDEKTIEHVYTEKELRYVTLTAPHGYRLEVTVPRKRGTFAANNRVYIRNVLVDATGFDGKVTHHEIPIDRWVNPGDSEGGALPDVTKSVKATVELGVENGSKAAVAQIALIQAKLVDDPNGPHYPAALKLQQIRSLIAAREMNRGAIKNIIDEALLSIPGELEKRTAEQARVLEERKLMVQSGQVKGAIAAGDATPDVMQELENISRLLGGTLQEQTEARTRLDALNARLRPPVSQ